MKRSTKTVQHRFSFLAAGAVIGTVMSNHPLHAEDIEIYTAALGGGFEEQIRPNILYIVDTSGSMTRPPGFFIDPKEYWDGAYDPSTVYPGACDPTRVYRISDDSDAAGNQYLNSYGYPIEEPNDPANPTGEEEADFNFQSCDNEYHFPLADLVCRQALDAFNDPDRGWYVDHWAEQVGTQSDGDRDWGGLDSADNTASGWRECAGDWGVHGMNDTDPAVYPAENGTGWTTSAADSKAYDNILGNSEYVVAPGNYLNWLYAAGQDRITAVKIALREIIQELPGETNVGLMRFDTGVGGGKSNTEGGMMFHGFVEVGEGANRQSLVNTLMNLDNRTDGGTPLGETMLEAAYVFAGGPVYFGHNTTDADGNPMHSVPSSRQDPTPGTEGYKYYKSPIEYSCQQNSVVYLTDGAATSDYSADSYYSAYDGAINVDDPWERGGSYWTPSGYVSFRGGFDFLPDSPAYLEDEDGDGDIDDCDDATLNCLPKITAWLANEDVNPDIAGDQFVYTNTIGFMPAGATDGEATLPDPAFLQEAADRGKGQFFQVTSFDELKDAFKVLTRKAVASNTAFTAPALAVNAFNQTRDQDEVLFAMFKSGTSPDWKGNLKKYRFDKDDDGNLRIEDADDNPAVIEDLGVFAHDARSFWSAADDGDKVPEGGAASNLPITRNIYTWFGDTASKALINPSYAFAGWNASSFASIDFGLDGTESYGRQELIQWLGGLDLRDEDGDSVTSEQRFHMGDPLHSRPIVVTYGGTETDPDQKIFVTTNDGFLHVIDMDTGVEDFAFVAAESLKNAKRMYESDASQGKAYGLDGAPVLWADTGEHPGINVNGDTTDHVYLYVGMRRGGRSYYAFDFTNPASPKILWRIQGGDADNDGTDNDTFYHLGQSWSTPQLGSIRINNVPTKVLIFGGGFDTKQDDPDGGGATEDIYVEDDVGRAIYMVNAETGERIWWAGSDPDADLVISDMKNSIPSDVAVVDTDSDGWTDRLYVGDTGGRMFRIDIEETPSTAGTPPASWGGMIADLGAGAVSDDAGTPKNEQTQANRKFFYPPDVVMVENGNNDYLAIAIGSGARNHPSYPVTGDTAVEDMFFVLRDPNIINRPAGNDYAYGIYVDSAGDILYDATDNEVMSSVEATRNTAIQDMESAKGWYIRLEHEGEKALAQAITFNYQTMFTTFEPQDIDLATCQARTGIGRLYALNLRNGTPVSWTFDENEEDDQLTTEDRSYTLRRDGIPPAPTIVFPEANDGEAAVTAGPELPPIKPGTNAFKSYWYIPEN